MDGYTTGGMEDLEAVVIEIGASFGRSQLCGSGLFLRECAQRQYTVRCRFNKVPRSLKLSVLILVLSNKPLVSLSLSLSLSPR